ncbi:MAG: acetyl-CoA synthase, partial [Thermodesulfobacteriota bacterium]|nr:acetyl-CoA synthase [Thermodesulfobacteriota bacterium]
KAKAEDEARAKEVADREAEEQAISEQRAREREERLAGKPTIGKRTVSLTPAAAQKTKLEKMLEKLNRIHRRPVA